MHPSLPQMLADEGINSLYLPGITLEEFEKIAGNFNGLIGRSKFRLNGSILGLSGNLQFIARAGAGLDDIDLEYCKNQGIAVINAPEGNRDSVGEHTTGMLLLLLHRLRYAANQTAQGVWSRTENRGTELMGKTVGIIGFGNMGQAFARRLSGFGCKVLAYDKYLDAESWPRDAGLQFVIRAAEEQLFSEADIVSLHVPLTPLTLQMADEQWLRKFNKPLLLINTARGKIVNTEAVLAALQEGKLWGAALDVLENEKPASYTSAEQTIYAALTARPDVVVTPHIAGWSHQSYIRINEILVRKIVEFRNLLPHTV